MDEKTDQSLLFLAVRSRDFSSVSRPLCVLKFINLSPCLL